VPTFSSKTQTADAGEAPVLGFTAKSPAAIGETAAPPIAFSAKVGSATAPIVAFTAKTRAPEEPVSTFTAKTRFDIAPVEQEFRSKTPAGETL
jgi:hypothetical protein